MKVFFSALVVAVLMVVAAGCGGGGRHAATPTTTATTTTATGVKSCKLTPADHRAIAKSLRDIRRLRQIEKPLHTFTQRGTPAQQTMTDKFLLDSGNLPVNTRAHLLHLAKAATGLCGLCFGALEAEEPVVSVRLGKNPCGPS